MKMITSDHILNDEYFTYDRSELSLTSADRRVIDEYCIGISYLFSDKSEFEFKNFLRYFFKVHLDRKQAGGMNLVFSNRFIEKRSKIRSYQKLFYRENELIGENNFKEIEVGLSDDKSIFLGLIRLTEANLEYCLHRMFTSIFTFGFSADEQADSFYSDDFLRKINEEFLEISDMRYFNPLRAFLGLRGRNNMLFQIALHGNNDQSLDVLTSKESENYYLDIGRDYREQEKSVVYN